MKMKATKEREVREMLEKELMDERRKKGRNYSFCC